MLQAFFSWAVLCFILYQIRQTNKQMPISAPTSCSPAYFMPVFQVLLGPDHAAADGGKPHHYPRGHHLLQGRAHAALDRLQRGVGHFLPHGPGPQLPHRHRQGGQHGDHPGPAKDQDQVPERLVCGGLRLLHTRGLHLPHRGDSH